VKCLCLVGYLWGGPNKDKFDCKVDASGRTKLRFWFCFVIFVILVPIRVSKTRTNLKI